MVIRVRRTLAVFLAVIMAASCFVGLGTIKANADGVRSVKYAKNIIVSTAETGFFIDMSSKVKNIKSIKVTSSNKKVATGDSYGFVEVKKAGKTNLTIKVKNKKGTTKTFKATLKVVKYSNAFKSFKIGKKQLKSKFKKYTSAYLEDNELKTGKLVITPSKNWKIKSIKYESIVYNGDDSKYTKKTIKNKTKVSLNKGSDASYYLTIKMYNKKTGLTETYTIAYFVSSYED